MTYRHLLTDTSMTRRRALGLFAGAGAGALAAASTLVGAGQLPVAADAGNSLLFTTQADLIVYAEPGSDSDVLGEIPGGFLVWDPGFDEPANGYRYIESASVSGWVPDIDLYPGATWDTSVPPSPIIGGAPVTETTAMRSGPAIDMPIIAWVPAGEWVEVTAYTSGGLREVSAYGFRGWINDSYLGGDETGAFVTTEDVELRSGPGSNHPSLDIIAAGETVVDYDDTIENGFRHVEYGESTGWVNAGFLEKV